MLVYKACKTESKSSFVCQLPIGELSHMADVSSMISYIISESAVTQSDTHAAYTRDIVDIHVHATVYLYILFSCILF